MNRVRTYLVIVLVAISNWASAQTPPFDLYIVPHRGDTIRENIAKIFLHENRYGHVAFVKYTDGSKARFGAKDLKAFSFIESYSSFFGFNTKYTYHQVQTLMLADSTMKIRTPRFYEKIATCNGHTLYRDFVDNENEYWRYLVAAGNVLKYELPSRRNRLREALEKLMPDCLMESDYILWPKWASQHYKGNAPVKPVLNQ
jgi:hypothetical protein